MRNSKFIYLLFLYSSITFSSFCDINSPKPPVYGKTLNMIGDSITWWSYGEKFRCLMVDKGIEMDFVGTFSDPYGYRHDGHGGDTSKNVLDRMESIPYSDHYFLLIGTNDHIVPEETVKNINKICSKLYEKNNNAIIFISTILPKTDSFSPISEKINYLLRKSQQCNNCRLIDLGAHIKSLSDWEHLFTDGIHPNQIGYDFITDYLTPLLTPSANRY